MSMLFVEELFEMSDTEIAEWMVAVGEELLVSIVSVVMTGVSI